MTIKEEVEFLCTNAKEASTSIALASTDEKNGVLLKIAELLSENAEKIIEAAKALKTDNVLFVPGFWQEGDDHKECLERSLEMTKYLATLAKENGISIGFEDYDGETPVSESRNMLWYIENVPGTHCIFDTGNFLYEGEDVLEAYRRTQKAAIARTAAFRLILRTAFRGLRG